MKAMIFAAGLGTRLKPITDTLPKALVPICGKPLLEHVIGRLESAGIDRIVVNVHHFADKIEDYIAAHPHCAGIVISDERDLLRDTGGGIRHARPYLRGDDGDGRFLVHNVDIISNLDINAFVSEVRCDALASLVVSERKTSRYLLFDKDSMRLVGWTNLATGEVRSPYPDISPEQCRMLAFSGIHLISDRIFGIMDSMRDKFGEKFSIIDFYLAVASDYPIYGWVPDNFEMADVGKIETLVQAEELCRRLMEDSSCPFLSGDVENDCGQNDQTDSEGGVI